jgi:hypothetical protein
MDEMFRPLKRLETAIKEVVEALEAMPEVELTASELQLMALLEVALDCRAMVRARATLAGWKERN